MLSPWDRITHSFNIYRAPSLGCHVQDAGVQGKTRQKRACPHGQRILDP